MSTVTSPPRVSPVLCLTADRHRDFTVASDARAGRFTHIGVTLDLGTRPDWRSGLAHDEEWRIEWVKLYEGLDLAHACELEGDRSFLEAWVDLVESFCDQIPVGCDSSDVAARRMQNWLYAWQRLARVAGTPDLRDGFAERLRTRLLAEADHLRCHLTAERNHRTLELYTLLLVGLALEPDSPRPEEALALLADNAATDIWDDGVHRECSTDYHLIVLRSLVGAIVNARRAGIAVPPDLVDRANRAADFALHVQRPDGITPALSDGDQDDFRDLLDHAGSILERSDLTWAASGGKRGRAPRERLVTFPVGGYCIQRSGWGDRARSYADERFCIFDCGPVGDGGHGHYDQLSVEVAAGGRSLVVDPGRYTYAADDGWRRWFKGTAAHNTVCVDGLDQTPFRPGKPAGPTAAARLLHRATVPGLDMIVAEVCSPRYEARHTRAVLFVDDDYWLIHDRLRGGRRHRYEARWHLSPDAQGQVVIERTATQTLVRAPGLVMCVPSWCGDVAFDDGWVSPAYGTKHAAPVVVVTAGGVADADFVTLLVPSDEPMGCVTVSASACGADSMADIACRPRRRARLSWQVDGAFACAVEETAW